MAALIETPTWQLATLPSAPQYWCATPTDWRRTWGSRCRRRSRPRAEISSLIRSRQALPHRRLIPGRLVDELLQALLVAVGQAGGHRLDRLAAAVEHQAAQVDLAPAALVLALHRLEHLLGEGLQALTDCGQLAVGHRALAG